MVYHYTSIESLYSILASYKASEDKDHFTFWASNALEQNDREELSFSCKDVHEAILEIEKEKVSNGEILSPKRLSKVFNWGYLYGKTEDDVIDEINQTTIETYTPFTLSFSHQKDKLLMWSMYANNGNGVCLAFEENELNFLRTDMTHVNDSIIYKKDVNKYREVIRYHYNEYLKIFNEDVNISLNKVYEEGCLTYKVMLESISPFFKNKAFEDEQEWRIAFYKSPSTIVYSRITGRLNKIHYVKVGLPISAIKKIIIGPCANYDFVRDLIIQEASECGIGKMMAPDFYEKSEVPYRIV